MLSKGSAKPGPPSHSYDLCGDVESIVGQQRLRYISPALTVRATLLVRVLEDDSG